MLYAVALLAGIANAVQAGWNGTLAKSLAQPFVAALTSFALGALVFVAVGLVTGRLQAPTWEALAAAPWWAWGGGVLGALVVASQLFVAQRIGAAPYLGLIVTAGVVTSLALDHFGWAGFDVHPANLWRIAGGLLMVVGVALVALF
jgi:bacterial/archaeal transporter family-2 protein